MPRPQARLSMPAGWIFLVTALLAPLIGAIGPARDVLAHGYALLPPSPNAVAELADGMERALPIGAAVAVALLLPWIVGGGRPRRQGAVARWWAVVIAAGLWAGEGLRFNASVASRWLERETHFGIDLPAALVDPAILGRNVAVTVGAVVLGLVLTFVLRGVLPGDGRRGPGRGLLVTACVVVLLACSTFALRAGLRPVPAGPDVILISVDALRADRLGIYGGPAGLTPALDRFAADAVVFDRAYAQEPWTLTSHMSMLTGLYPDVHGVDLGRPLAPSIWTVVERLRDAGYRTAASVMGCYWLSPEFGYEAGFDRYEEDDRPAAPRVDAAARWLLADERPGFLFLHLYDPHSDFGVLPYEASERSIARFAPGATAGFDAWTPPGGASEALHRVNTGELAMPDSLRAATAALYDAGVHDTDRALGTFFDALRAAGRYDDAWIVVLADHGEALGERGLFMHGDLMEATLRIPLLVKQPGNAGAGTRIDRLVETVDVAPTVLATVGLPPEDPSQGRSLISGAERTFALHRAGRDRAITTEDGWRLGYRWTDEGFAPRWLRRVDGTGADGPDVLADSLTVVDRWLEPITQIHRANAGLAVHGRDGAVALDPVDEDLLRSLGYIQ